MADAPQQNDLPSMEDFYIKYALYDIITFTEEQKYAAKQIMYPDSTLDAYCPNCSSISVLSRSDNNSWSSSWSEKDGIYFREFRCSRERNHVFTFIIELKNQGIQKIGQVPSMADINTYDVRKYSSVLKKERYRELTKAIGLASHGVGVGSFVYLRRIFEDLVEEAKNEAESKGGLDLDVYNKSRMAEKIELLQQYLPRFLVENRQLYGVLSKGIHELTENECLDAFPIVKLGIEIILDEHIAEKERKDKYTAASSAISNFNSRY